jgi:hypothetical protein
LEGAASHLFYHINILEVFMDSKYFYAKIEIDGRCVDLLLTNAETVRAFNRAKENPSIVNDVRGYTELCCEIPTTEKKCSIWKKMLGKCDCN